MHTCVGLHMRPEEGYGHSILFRLACLLKEGLSLTSRVRLAVINCSNPPVSNSSVILCGSRRFGLLSSKLTRILRWLSSPWFFSDYSNFKNATRMWCSKYRKIRYVFIEISIYKEINFTCTKYPSYWRTYLDSSSHVGKKIHFLYCMYIF